MTTRRRPLVATLLTISIAVVGSGLSAGAQRDPGPDSLRPATLPGQNLQGQNLQLELIDQDYSFEADGTIRLLYRITGDVERIAELSPPTTTTSTTTTTTTPATTTATATPETTAVETTTPATTPASTPDPSTTPTSSAPPTTAAPTTSTTVPPPISLSVDVSNFSALTGLAGNERYLDNILGQTSRPTAFVNSIDGVRILDVRDRIVVDDAGIATFTLNVETDGAAGVPSVENKLRFDAAGLYPIRVELRVADDVVAVHGTVVERLAGPEESPRKSEPVTLAVVANVNRPNGTNDALTDEQFQRVVALAAKIDSPVVAAIPPEVLAATSIDSAALNTALQHDELVAITDIELDVSSAVAAGQQAVFARQLRAGEDTLTEILPANPARRTTWISAEPLSAGGAQLLRDLGFRYLVMTPDLYAETIAVEVPATDRFINVALPDGGQLPVILIDALSEQLTTDAANATLTTSTPTEWAVRSMTDLLLDRNAHGQNAQLSRVLSTPNLDAPDPRLLVALERLALTTPDVRFTSASTLTGVTDTQRAPGGSMPALPTTAGPDLVQRIAQIETARLTLKDAESMLPADDERPQQWSDDLDALVSTAITNSDAGDVVDGLVDEADEIRDSITFPEPFTFTLTGRSGQITLRIGNQASEELTVVVHLSSSKLTFPDNDRTFVLRPDDNNDFEIPVRARSNGTSALIVEILTPNGTSLGEPVTLTSRVNAFTGLARALTGGFVLMLLTWWFNNWRSRRRARAD